MTRTTVYLFDFDGTLTTHDTLIAFIRYVHGTWRTLWGLMLHSPWLVLMKLHLYPNYWAKQRVFTHFFGGMEADRFDELCRCFAYDRRESLLRPQGVETMRRALEQGSRVIVVSASIDSWVSPFFGEAEADGSPLGLSRRPEVLGTRIEVKRGRVTGRFLTPNCYGVEKVRRVEAVLDGPREHYYIKAYGDSRGDREMLEYADEGHYRPFRH